MRLRVLLMSVCVLGLTACRNRHAQKDRQHLAMDAAEKRYVQDCPAAATASDSAKIKQCQAEHQRFSLLFQKTQAVDRGDCDRAPASRPSICAVQ
jgi:hypothetical protein